MASSRESDYDPRARPWYKGAIDLPPGPSGAGDGVFWTAPYTFYTAAAPGMTAAGTTILMVEQNVRFGLSLATHATVLTAGTAR